MACTHGALTWCSGCLPCAAHQEATLHAHCQPALTTERATPAARSERDVANDMVGLQADGSSAVLLAELAAQEAVR